MARVFAHKFKWSMEEVDALPITFIGAYMHDFEAERVRMEATKTDPDWESRYRDRIIKVDDRVPLNIRVLPVPVIYAWVQRWNKAHPDEPPMADPDMIPLASA